MNLNYESLNSIPKQGFGNEIVRRFGSKIIYKFENEESRSRSGLGTRKYIVLGTKSRDCVWEQGSNK